MTPRLKTCIEPGIFLAGWVRYYNEKLLHSSLQYLRPVDYYVGNPGALLADRKRKLKEAAVRRREVNRCRPEVTLVNGAAELGWSEQEPKRQRRQSIDKNGGQLSDFSTVDLSGND